MITVDSAKCSKCGFCIDVCPNYVIGSNSDTGTTEIRYPEQCCICGHCVAICPESAIDHKDMPNEGFKDIADIKILPENMKSFLQSRRSIRVFKENVIPKEHLEELRLLRSIRRSLKNLLKNYLRQVSMPGHRQTVKQKVSL